MQIALAHYLRRLPWAEVVGGTHDHSNFSKVFQLGCAAGRSWSIPQSCLTNDPAEAADFVAGGPTVYKGPSSAKTWASVFGPADILRLPLLHQAPVLFQRRIVGFDVRVHVVSGNVFGEAIRSSGCDYRRDRDATFAPMPVPAALAADCVGLTEQMRLVFSGIDFKVTDAGKWFFLEANSSPCFQGYDRRAGGAISDALADHLKSVR